MSILAQLTPTTAPTVPQEQPGPAIFAMAFCLVVAIAVAWGLGVFRAGSIVGPTRIGRKMPLAPLIGVAAIGGFVWVLAQVVHVGGRDPEKLDANDFALVATAPAAVGLLFLLMGDLGIGRRTLQRLGLSFTGMSRWLIAAILAMFAVMPLMLATGVALEMIYQAVNYKHPTEHHLLKVMKDAPLHAKALLVVGACIFAPLFEETFFRGHIQTILGSALRGLGGGAARWGAVGTTSFLFAVIHEPWTAPLIFLLSVCLGYAYERTGKLWVPIFMHAIFNSLQTAFFLLAR